jgi:hypothetical protein
MRSGGHSRVVPGECWAASRWDSKQAEKRLQEKAENFPPGALRNIVYFIRIIDQSF